MQVLWYITVSTVVFCLPWEREEVNHNRAINRFPMIFHKLYFWFISRINCRCVKCQAGPKTTFHIRKLSLSSLLCVTCEISLPNVWHRRRYFLLWRLRRREACWLSAYWECRMRQSWLVLPTLSPGLRGATERKDWQSRLTALSSLSSHSTHFTISEYTKCFASLIRQIIGQLRGQNCYDNNQ